MNKIYKLIWNESVQAWVSVSELSPSRGKKAKVIGSLSLLALSIMAMPAQAASTGLRIDNGATRPTNLISTYNRFNVTPVFDKFSMRGIQVQNNSLLNYSNGTVNVDMTTGTLGSTPNLPIGINLDGNGGSSKSNVVNLNNATINVKGQKGAIGIDDNDLNTVKLNNVTVNVNGNASRSVGYDQYTYYECSSAAPCATRVATATGKTTMNVSNNNGFIAGWVSAGFVGKPATLNITGTSITNIRTTSKRIPYGYAAGSNGNIIFNNATLSGTSNGKNDVYINGGGTVRFKGTTTSTSPLHVLTKYGQVYFDQISGNAFTLAELRSQQGNSTGDGYDYGVEGSDGGVFNSNVYLGNKTLIVTGQHTTPDERNLFMSSLHGSANSKFIKQGNNVLSFNATSKNFLGELVVEKGTFQLIDNSIYGANLSKVKQATIKSGATLSGYGSSDGSSGVIGKTVIEKGGNLQVGSVVSNTTSRRNFTVAGDLNNNGSVKTNNAKGVAGNTLYVQGNYVGGAGSDLHMAFSQTKVDPGTPYESIKTVSDKLVVKGNTSGTSTVHVSSLGNTGINYANQNGILLIDVAGQSNANFIQGNRIVAGPYDYYLVRGNSQYGGGVDANKDWYLNNHKPATTVAPTVKPTVKPTVTPTIKPTVTPTVKPTVTPTVKPTVTPTVKPTVTPTVKPTSAPQPGPEIIRPEAGSYNSTAYVANNMFKLGLQDRINGYAASTYEIEGGGMDGESERGSAWISYTGSSADFKDGSGQLDSDLDKNTVIIGSDMVVYSSNDQNKVTVGVMGAYGRAKGSTHNSVSGHNSRHETDGYGIGVYGSYQQNANDQSGLYADSWLMWNDFNNEVNGDGLPKVTYDSKGVTAALELGYNWNIAEKNNVRYVLQPHAQLMYQNVQADDFTEQNGTKVRFDDGSGLQTTLGLRAAAHIQTSEQTAITPYAEVNWVHNNKDYRVYMNDIASDLEHKGGAGELKLGVQGDLSRNLTVKAEASYLGGSNDYKEVGGSLGLKYRF